MKIVIAPDSFKDSLSADEAARIIEAGLRHSFPHARYERMPVADGGEGTVAALVAARGGRFVRTWVTGPLGERVLARYGQLPGGLAVVEMAAASGLERVPAGQRNPMLTTSYGAGELVRHALSKGATRVLLGIGGSATVDGGLGFAQALGVRFLDSRGRCLPAPLSGAALQRVAGLDAKGLDASVAAALRVACDVESPLVGPLGAAVVFGPQKGATLAQVRRLDAGLRALGRLLEKHCGKSLLAAPGAGAAGGLGGMLMGVFGCRLEQGAGLVLEFAEAADRLRGASLVVTGEGRLDGQTHLGKAPHAIFLLARQMNIPVAAVAGSLDFDVSVKNCALSEVAISAVCKPQTVPEALGAARRNLRSAARRLGALLLVGQSLARLD